VPSWVPIEFRGSDGKTRAISALGMVRIEVGVTRLGSILDICRHFDRQG